MSIDLATYEALREDGTLEARLAQGGLPRSMWKTYSAFANTDGGVIVLGLEKRENTVSFPAGSRTPTRSSRRSGTSSTTPRR